MDAPPFSRCSPVLRLAPALFALVVTTGAQAAEVGAGMPRSGAGPTVARLTPSDLVSEEEPAAGHRTGLTALTQDVQALTSVLLISPYGVYKKRTPPTAVVTVHKKSAPLLAPPPLVVKPPIQPIQVPKPPGKNPGPGPSQAPEPSSLGAGLVGGSLMLMAWWRQRRRRRRPGQTAEDAAPAETEMAAVI